MQDLLRPVCWLLTAAYSARSMLKGSFPIMGHDYVEASNTLIRQVLVCKRCGDRFESWNKNQVVEFDEECEHCDDCGRAYCDVYTLPDALWARIHERAPAGLLCPTCALDRLASLLIAHLPQRCEHGYAEPHKPDGVRWCYGKAYPAELVERLRQAVEGADEDLWPVAVLDALNEFGEPG